MMLWGLTSYTHPSVWRVNDDLCLCVVCSGTNELSSEDSLLVIKLMFEISFKVQISINSSLCLTTNSRLSLSATLSVHTSDDGKRRIKLGPSCSIYIHVRPVRDTKQT